MNSGGAAFTDVTRECGIQQIIDDKYQQSPKWWLSGLYLVDLNGDGKLDLFFGAHGGGGALATLNDGKGRFTRAKGSYPTTEIHLPYDINEDGKTDLQMTFGDGGGKWWINESTKDTLSFRDSGVTAGQGRCNAMIDINRDGKVDWLHERPGVVFELGDGKGNFKKDGSVDAGSARNETNMHPADVDGDGFIDLVAQWGRYDFAKGRSRIYLGDGKGNFRDATKECGITEEAFAVKGVGDVNQDGAPDLMVLENVKPEIYLNDGKGHFTKKEGALVGMERSARPQYASWGLAVVTDIDSDGVADILWNGRNFLWVLRGTGGGRFAYMNTTWSIEDKSAASVDDGLCFGDIDGDGDLDIVGYTGSLDNQRQVKVYRNDLSKAKWVNVRPIGASGNRGAAGSRIRITEPGNPRKLLWCEQVQILDSQSAHSCYSYPVTERHFGLGERSAVDVSVEFYPSGKKVEKKGVKADTTVEIRETGGGD